MAYSDHGIEKVTLLLNQNEIISAEGLNSPQSDSNFYREFLQINPRLSAADKKSRNEIWCNAY